MRILHVIATLDGHGAERQMAALACECQRRGHDVAVCALTREGPVGAILDRKNVPHTCLKKRSKIGLLTFLRLRKMIRATKPDVLHTWLFTGNTYGRLASVRLFVPAVIASERSVDRWRTLVHRAIDRRLLAVTDLVLANAEAVRRFYIDFEDIPPERITVIPNAIVVERFSGLDKSSARRSLGVPPDAWIVLTVGRLEPQKGLGVLVRAMALLQDLRPRPFLCVVGDGPQRTELEALAHACLPEQTYFFAGYQDDVAPWYAASDVFALPSLWEGMPNVVLEAMAARRPVVATAVDGTQELIKPGSTGLLVPPSNESELAEAIRKIRENESEARDMVEAAFDHVRRNYSTAKTADATLALYQQVLKSKAR